MKWTRGMIGVVLLLMSAFSAEAAMPQQEAVSQFVLGNQAYKEGAYEKAIEEYRAILEGDRENGHLYYNLANAYFKNRQLGYSILNYERARRLMPRDSDLKFNLAYAESLVRKTAQPEPAGFVSEMISGHVNFYTLDEMFLMTTVLVVLLGAVFLMSRFLKWPRVMKTVSRSVLIILILVYSIGLILKVRVTADQAVIVSNTPANFEPLETATMRFELFEGMKVKVLRYKDGWVKVERDDGLLGWVTQTSLEEI